MALNEEFRQQGQLLFKYRSFIPILFIPIGIYFFCKTIEVGNTVFDKPYAFICLAVGIFGLLIRVFTVGNTPANTSGRNTKEGQVADMVNTTGIYSLIRHPLYVGNFFMFLSLAMLINNLWFTIIFSLLYFIYYERIMYAEEHFLTQKFGKGYTDWASTTPAVIPNTLNIKKSEYSFSFKKVIKKEKNGFAALLILFYLFNLLEQYISNGKLSIIYNIWFALAFSSLIIYFILKYLKYNTNILSEDDNVRRRDIKKP